MSDVSDEAFKVARERYDASGDWRTALEGAFSVLLADARKVANGSLEGELAFAHSELDAAFVRLDDCRASVAELRSQLALARAELAAWNNKPAPPPDRTGEVAEAVRGLAVETGSADIGQVADFIVHRFLT